MHNSKFDSTQHTKPNPAVIPPVSASNPVPNKKRKFFMCDVGGCNKGFMQKYNLRRHLLTHTDKKPHTCEASKCGKTFKRKDALLRHTGTYHPEVYAKISRRNQISKSRPIDSSSDTNPIFSMSSVMAERQFSTEREEKKITLNPPQDPRGEIFNSNQLSSTINGLPIISPEEVARLLSFTRSASEERASYPIAPGLFHPILADEWKTYVGLITETLSQIQDKTKIDDEMAIAAVSEGIRTGIFSAIPQTSKNPYSFSSQLQYLAAKLPMSESETVSKVDLTKNLQQLANSNGGWALVGLSFSRIILLSSLKEGFEVPKMLGRMICAYVVTSQFYARHLKVLDISVRESALISFIGLLGINNTVKVHVSHHLKDIISTIEDGRDNDNPNVRYITLSVLNSHRHMDEKNHQIQNLYTSPK